MHLLQEEYSLNKAEFTELTKPFAKSQVDSVTKVIDGRKKTFDNVSPHHYVHRLIDNVPIRYSTKESPPVFSPSGKSVSVVTELTLHDALGGNTDIIHSANGTSEIENDDPITEAFAVKSAASDGLKRAMLKLGVGLELYGKPATATDDDAEPEEDEEEETPPAKAETRRPPAKTYNKPKSSSGGKGWDGSLAMKGGKHDGLPYSKLQGSYINWYIGSLEEQDKTNLAVYDMLTKEKARREAEGSWNPEEGNSKRGPKKPTTKTKLTTDDDSW